MDETSYRFYQEFAAIYDNLVSFKERRSRELPFWSELVERFHIRNILDMACGTGHHALIFKELGLHVDAMDLSDAMLAKARANATAASLDMVFKQGDFRKIGSYYSMNFDAIVCLGNSLPYLKESKDILHVIEDIRSHLVPAGLFILEMRNFDYLMTRRPRFFPASLRDDSGFIYALDYHPDRIIFNLLFFDLKTKSFKTYESTYFPLPFESLLIMLKENGFTVIDTWADFIKSKYIIEESPRFILICQKS